jgi:hypothetical protein
MHRVFFAWLERTRVRRTPVRSFSAIALLLLGLGSASALALSTLDGVSAGWIPMVSWWGAGDARKAVQNLDRLTAAFAAVLHHSEVDGATRKFVDDALEQLGDFDLGDFHDLLPETQSGFRVLRVRGDLRGDHYALRRAEPGTGFLVSARGPRRGLADLSQVLRAKRIEPEHGPASYLLNVGFGLGVGDFSWDRTVHGIADFGRIVADADPRVAAADDPQPSREALSLTKKLHPKLAAEDVASAALLFDAYPAVSRTFSQLGELLDMRSTVPNSDYQHVTVRMRAMPERLAVTHPALAEHMRKLGQLAHFDFRWVDDQNRTLMRWVIDSHSLLFSMECYLKEGRLLPVAGKVVLEDQGIDPMGDALKHTRLFMQTRVSLFGIAITLRKLRANVHYEPGETHARLTGTVKAPPEVEVEGAAAGFIDALIPGNLKSLTHDFFAHAARSNDKKGVVVAIGVGSEARDRGGVIEWNMELEALDSKLVKMGVGMVNERLVPSGEVLTDAKALLTALHDAFVADLSRYKARLGT